MGRPKKRRWLELFGRSAASQSPRFLGEPRREREYLVPEGAFNHPNIPASGTASVRQILASRKFKGPEMQETPGKKKRADASLEASARGRI